MIGNKLDSVKERFIGNKLDSVMERFIVKRKTWIWFLKNLRRIEGLGKRRSRLLIHSQSATTTKYM